VIELSKEFQLYDLFKSGGIEPLENPQPLTNFQSVLNKAWGNGTYELICEKGSDKLEYLTDVAVCLDLDNKLIKCPYVNNVQGNCKSELIMFPPCSECIKESISPIVMAKEEIEYDELFWILLVVEIMMISALLILCFKPSGRREKGKTHDEVLTSDYEKLQIPNI